MPSLFKTLCAQLLLILGGVFPACVMAKAVSGFADLHVHIATEYAFGGNWLHGNLEGDIAHAVGRCDGNSLNIYLPATNPLAKIPRHAATKYRVIDEFIGAYGKDEYGSALTSGDTGVHLGKRRGYDPRQCKTVCLLPNPFNLGACLVNESIIPGTCPKEHFEHWPSWDSIAHQQTWEGWIKDAHDNGMSVMVASLMDSELLCNVTPNLSRKYACDEMATIDRQLDAVKRFADNRSWVSIAYSASHAREIVNQGKLAMVLAVEVTNLFPSGDYLAQLDNLYARGVRSFQVVHHANNRFAGAAPLPKLVDLAKKVEAVSFSNFTDIDDFTCLNGNGQEGDCNGDTYLNPKGLSSDGELLVKAMMEKGVLVDVAHLSRKSIKDVYALSKRYSDYPIFYSHAHFWDVIDSDHKNEKYINQEEIAYIQRTQGMVGIRTGPEKTVSDYENLSGVDNNCQGSSRSFAQSLAFGDAHDLNIGFASDLNGFIQQMLPRHGDNKESCGGSGSEQSQQIMLTQSDFDKQGLGHIGLLPALLQDLKNIGLKSKPAENIEGSSEQFIQMWERAEKKRSNIWRPSLFLPLM